MFGNLYGMVHVSTGVFVCACNVVPSFSVCDNREEADDDEDSRTSFSRSHCFVPLLCSWVVIGTGACFALLCCSAQTLTL